MAVKKWIKDSRFVIAMLMVQVIATGLQLLSRIILNEGSFVFAFMAYRHIVAAVCVGPFAFFLERGNGEHKLSWWAFFWLFAVALTGVPMAMGLFYYGLRDTTATYATNFLNLIPIVTFLFSIILGIEKLQLHSTGGKIKSFGALLCLGGAVTIALYKGKSFHITWSNIVHPSSKILTKTVKHWTRGTIFLVSSCFCYGLWFMLQAKLFKIFPHKFWGTFYISIIATFQLVAIGLCMNRSRVAWHLSWNLQLITILYSGALATAATFYLISWAVAAHGPTYPSMFNPLALIFVIITEALFLGEPMTVGSLLGTILMVIGFYLFLWGKKRQMATKTISVTETNEEDDKGRNRQQA